MRLTIFNICTEQLLMRFLKLMMVRNTNLLHYCRLICSTTFKRYKVKRALMLFLEVKFNNIFLFMDLKITTHDNKISEEKAKVVAAAGGTELIELLDPLAILMI